MTVTFDHDLSTDPRRAWRNRYRMLRVVAHAGPAPQDSGTAIIAAMLVGVAFWIAVFALILSLI